MWQLLQCMAPPYSAGIISRASVCA